MNLLRRLLRLIVLDLRPLGASRDFRLLYLGQFVSFAGSMITYVAVPYQVYELTHSSLAVGMLGLALRAAGAFTGERERQTLDSLLTTDLTASEILTAKFRGCFHGLRGVRNALLTLLVVGLVTGAVFPAFALLALLALAVHGAFAVCLGLLCSLHSRTTLRATVATITSPRWWIA